MGLACARNLQQLGIPFRGYDRHTGPGGLWDIDNPHSTLYESAHLISSRHMTEFAAFPMPPGPAYPNHRELRQYFRDYAAHFALDAQYAYGTRVEQIAPAEGGRWAVTTVSEPGRDDFAPADLPRTTTLHDGVLIASGSSTQTSPLASTTGRRGGSRRRVALSPRCPRRSGCFSRAQTSFRASTWTLRAS